ncbi:MAG: DUF4403 family protein [Deltaproteobacteria bacterium]|nr:DUF4403 family protein [Deltaproteobacteria bacterium]
MRYASLFLVLSACAGESLYPPRPAVAPGPPVADPPYSRIVAHVSLSKEGLTQMLETVIPQTSEGTFQLFGERTYKWTRGPLELRFDNAAQKITVRAEVDGEAQLPAKTMSFKLELLAEVQPVVSARYKVKLQTPLVNITTNDRFLKVAEWGAGIIGLVKKAVEDKLREQTVDLAPMVQDAYARASQPLEVPIGDAKACIDLGVKSIEFGPTLLVDGFEKDLALVLGPSVTLPCPVRAVAPSGPVNLPTLQNVANVPSGPFTVIVPVAASYQELQRAMTKAFTDGKLYFAKDFPNLYLEKPEVYANGGEVVVKLHIDGYVEKGFKIGLSGDLFLSGHPAVHDNELEFDDMTPTIETSNALLKLKTKLDADDIKRQVKQALRLDISSRLLSVRQKLNETLTYNFNVATNASGCFKADVGRIEVTNIYAHDTYLRLYVQVSAQAGATVPCPTPPASQPVAGAPTN